MTTNMTMNMIGSGLLLITLAAIFTRHPSRRFWMGAVGIYGLIAGGMRLM